MTGAPSGSPQRGRLPPYWTGRRTRDTRASLGGWVVTGLALLLWVVWVIYTELRFSVHEWRALVILAATGVLWDELGWADRRMWFRIRVEASRPDKQNGTVSGITAIWRRWRPAAQPGWWRHEGLLPLVALTGTLVLAGASILIHPAVIGLVAIVDIHADKSVREGLASVRGMKAAKSWFHTALIGALLLGALTVARWFTIPLAVSCLTKLDTMLMVLRPTSRVNISA